MTDETLSEDPPAAPDTPAAISSFKTIGFFAADYATVQDGKVSAVGAYFQILRFPAYPASLPGMALVAVLEAPFHTNQRDHSMEIRLLDPDRKPTEFQVQGSFRTAPKIDQDFGEAGTIPLAVPIYGLQIPRPGTYKFTLSIDQKPLASYAIKAIQVAAFGAQFAPPA